MQVFYVGREELAPNIWEFSFRPERPVDYAPGQYANLILPGAAGDPRGAGRVLTFTSLPTDPLIKFVVKYVEPHSLHKGVLFALRDGNPAEINDAMGDLILPKDASLPLVFVAGGIGIASFASMLKELLAKREERQIFLFYAVRDARQQIYRDLTKAYPLALHNITIAPNRLTAKQIVDTTPPEALMYLSGSQRFVEGLRYDLLQLGKSHTDIAFDYFEGYDEL